MAKRRLPRGSDKGRLWQVQPGPRGGEIWQRVDPITFRARRLRRRPNFGPSDVVLDFTGRSPRQYVADASPGGRWGRFRSVPYGTDPATGAFDPEQANVYAADARRELLDDLARDKGIRNTNDRVRVWFVPAAGGLGRRFTVESWQRFLAADHYRDSRPDDSGADGEWVLAYQADDGSMGEVIMVLDADGEL